MARLPRYVIPGQPQHIIQRGNNRQVIFAAAADYHYFHDVLSAAADTHGLAIHAYVWMTNHIHLLATPLTGESISKVFQSVGRRYVQYFNGNHQRTGTLWEGRYRATVVDNERYLLTVMRYIELNPVRAGLVARPEDYPWSSYRCNGLGQPELVSGWLRPHEEYQRLGANDAARQSAYRQLFQETISDDDLRVIRESTHKGWALGGARFKEEVEALGQRRTTSKGVGRPRKN